MCKKIIKFPPWLHQKLPSKKKEFFYTKDILKKYNQNTVCEEAKCPNRFICFEKKHATFLALGKYCTRKCAFCDIAFSKKSFPPDKNEPKKIALISKKLNLKHIVITMVTRDDLIDGGASHIADIIKEVKKLNKTSSIEILVSDFGGNTKSLDIVLDKKPKIFNHNIETVFSLSTKIRNKASYQRSLKILRYAKNESSSILVKSGFMVGLGEKDSEVKKTIYDLKKNGCDIITIGQYLKPSNKCIEVKEFIHPDKFKEYRDYALEIGIKYISSDPFARSSLKNSTF